MNLLTQHEAAIETRLSARTLERHRTAGTGPKFVRLGRRVFYRRQEVEAWVVACTRSSTSEAFAASANPEPTRASAKKKAPGTGLDDETPGHPYTPLDRKDARLESEPYQTRRKKGGISSAQAGPPDGKRTRDIETEH